MSTARRLLRGGFSCLALVCVLGCGASRPASLGVMDRRLASCPITPNCASTQEEGSAVAPIEHGLSRDEARRLVVDVLRSMPGARVVTVAPGYVRAEFTSDTFGFVDDVEAYLEDSESVVHLRSASRTGFWDFGANRRRLREIRDRFFSATDPREAASRTREE